MCRSHPLRSKNARPLGCVHPRAASCSQPHRRAVPSSSRPVQSGAVWCSLCAVAVTAAPAVKAQRAARAREQKASLLL